MSRLSETLNEIRHFRRIIQDSTIDLVRPILSCNDQTSIKIAE